MFPVAPSVACRSGPGSWRSGSFFYASALTAGSRSARRCVTCSSMERSWVLWSGCCWPSRVLAGPEAEALTPSPADRRDAWLRRIGSSAGLRPPPRSPRRHAQRFVRRRAPAAAPRSPAPAPADAAARCDGGSTTPSSAGPVHRTFLRVAMLDRRRPRPEVMPCFPAAAVEGAGLHDRLRPGVVHRPTRPAGQVRPGSPRPSGRAGSPGPWLLGPRRGSGVGVRAPVGRDTGWLTYSDARCFCGPDLEVRRGRRPRGPVKPQSARVSACLCGRGRPAVFPRRS